MIKAPSKCLLLLVMTLLFLSGSVGLTFADSSSVNSVEEGLTKTLTSLAEDYLVARHRVLITGNQLVLREMGPWLVGEASKSVDEVVDLQLHRREALAEHQAGYTDYDMKLSVEAVDRDDTQATLNITEHSTLRFETPTSEEPVLTPYRMKHQFLFLEEDGKWLLAEDRRLDEPAPVKPEEGFEPVGVALSIGSPGGLKEEPGFERMPDRRLSELPAGQVYWNRVAAKNYARRHALDYNEYYRDFSGNDQGGDCTNFVSQAMRAGGWPDDLGWFRSAHNWWYNTGYQSVSWVNVHKFWWFTNYDDRGAQATRWDWFWIGDTIQVDFDADGYLDHNVIVTRDDGSYGGGDFYVSYHTNDTRNKPIWDFRATVRHRHSNARFYGWYLMNFDD